MGLPAISFSTASRRIGTGATPDTTMRESLTFPPSSVIRQAADASAQSNDSFSRVSVIRGAGAGVPEP